MKKIAHRTIVGFVLFLETRQAEKARKMLLDCSLIEVHTPFSPKLQVRLVDLRPQSTFSDMSKNIPWKLDQQCSLH